MSFTWLSTRYPKSRKPRTCAYCNRVIPAGEVHLKQCEVHYGSFLEMRAHLECDEIARRWNQSEEIDFSPADFREELDRINGAAEPE